MLHRFAPVLCRAARRGLCGRTGARQGHNGSSQGGGFTASFVTGAFASGVVFGASMLGSSHADTEGNSKDNNQVTQQSIQPQPLAPRVSVYDLPLGEGYPSVLPCFIEVRTNINRHGTPPQCLLLASDFVLRMTCWISMYSSFTFVAMCFCYLPGR